MISVDKQPCSNVCLLQAGWHEQAAQPNSNSVDAAFIFPPLGTDCSRQGAMT